MRNITGTTRLGGLLGSPVSHSLSPAIYNDSFEQLGIDCVYLCFDAKPDALPVIVDAFRKMNVFGFNLTMPDKEAVLPLLDEFSEAARLIGAVNTVSMQDGRLTGHNTDGIGYMKSVRTAGIQVLGQEMTLMGCGGAAQAIAVQAALDGVRCLHLACRRSASWEKAVSLVERINARTDCRADLTDLADEEKMGCILQRSVLLTNATSAGMGAGSKETPLPFRHLLRKDLAVSDIIYNPSRTQLLQDAHAAGCRTFNGRLMLLYQAEEAFRIWTGLAMPVQMIHDRYFAGE